MHSNYERLLGVVRSTGERKREPPQKEKKARRIHDTKTKWLCPDSVHLDCGVEMQGRKTAAGVALGYVGHVVGCRMVTCLSMLVCKLEIATTRTWSLDNQQTR